MPATHRAAGAGAAGRQRASASRLGVNVSFFGHRRWTFRRRSRGRVPRSLARFWVVALLGFALNTWVRPPGYRHARARLWLGIPLIAGVTPVVTFTLSKLWAFRG